MDSFFQTNIESTQAAVAGSVRRAVRRNIAVWMTAFVVFCVTDYFHVHHGPIELGWFDRLFLPLFCFGTFWANTCLFGDEPHWIVRRLEVATVTFFVLIVGVFSLVIFAIGFHGMIGGDLF